MNKINKVLRFFCVFVFCFSISAWAVLPIVYGVAALAGASFFAYTYTKGVEQLSKTIHFCAPRLINQFKVERNMVTSQVYAVPQGKQSGVSLNLSTSLDSLKGQIKNSPSSYPKITQAIRNAQPVALSQGSWGIGDDFNEAFLPQVGDIVALNDGTNVRVTSVSNQCHNLGYSRSLGYSQYRNNHRFLDVWTACNGSSSSQTSNSGITYSTEPIENPTADDLTDAQWEEILTDNQDEATQAQRDLYNRANGNSASGSGSSPLPGSPSTGQFLNPTNNNVPTADEISDAVDSADGISQPQPSSPETVSTTTTVTRGDPVIYTDPETGITTVTIEITTTVTNSSTGEIISQKTETQTYTYPPGSSIPDFDSGSESVTQDDQNFTPPPNLTVPELAEVDFSPLFDGANVLRHKFPFAIIGTITDFLTSFSVEPETPHFEMVLGEHEFTVSLELLDDFAFWWRRFVRVIIIAFAAYAAVHICMK